MRYRRARDRSSRDRHHAAADTMIRCPWDSGVMYMMTQYSIPPVIGNSATVMPATLTPVAVALLITLAGCANSENSGLTHCTEPRPQICTNEYNPVCATLAGGQRETRATGCTACADAAVVGWVMGACEATGR
jgi:hypothetical protein